MMENKEDYKIYSTVEKQEVEWLWYPYIPYGKLTLLQGDPGDGKSTFMINIASALTRGGLLPDGKKLEQIGNVIYQGAEDNVGDTIKPRLEEAGADCDKLYRQLRHQINSSSQEKVLQYINYLIFEHTENVYFSKKIEEEIKNNKMIEKLSQEANGLPRFGHLSADNMFGIGYEAVKPEDIPNFLDESWAIKEEESTDGEE